MSSDAQPALIMRAHKESEEVPQMTLQSLHHMLHDLASRQARCSLMLRRLNSPEGR